MLFAQPLSKRTSIMRVTLSGVGPYLETAISYKSTLPLAMIFAEPKTKSFFGYWQSAGKPREAGYSHALMMDLIELFDASWRDKGWGSHEPWRIHSDFSSRTQELLIRRVAATMGA